VFLSTLILDTGSQYVSQMTPTVDQPYIICQKHERTDNGIC